jgi:ligand-binding SRPBCC domain-containing protein
MKRTQVLPISLKDAWDFFSAPHNLPSITPPYMDFRISGNSGLQKMYAGQIIRYRVSILPYIRIFWVSEITHVSEPFFFVDEQRFGPYRWWHHQHIFREVNGGIEMTDEVNYALPLGPLGQFAHWLFVRRQLNSIFDYRFQILQNFFKLKSIRKSA